MSAEDPLTKLYKTFSFRVKDATSGKRLVALGNKVNTVWNYCNEISIKSAERGPKWVTKKELRDLTKGASRELDLPSQVIQETVDEFIDRRRAHGKPRLRWRVSHGAKRSLGWVPFTNQKMVIDGQVAILRGQRFRLWKHRDIEGVIKSGNFSQDARGRWYCNLVVEVERPAATNRQKIVGIDLGFTTVAAAYTHQTLSRPRSIGTWSPSLRRLSDADASGRRAQSTQR